MVLSRQLGLHCDTCLEFSLRGHGIISVSCRVNWTMQGFAKMCMPTGLDIFGVILACISEVSSPLALCWNWTLYLPFACSCHKWNLCSKANQGIPVRSAAMLRASFHENQGHPAVTACAGSRVCVHALRFPVDTSRSPRWQEMYEAFSVMGLR